MTDLHDITLPRLPGESSRAYASRLAYITAGPERSLEKLIERAQTEPKAGLCRRLATLKIWSSRYAWVELARRYDDTIAGLATRAAADAYRRALESHRARYRAAGETLYRAGCVLLKQLHERMNQPPQVIEGKDGKQYTIPPIEITPQTLLIAARGLVAGADLEAYALRLDRLLPMIEADEDR